MKHSPLSRVNRFVLKVLWEFPSHSRSLKSPWSSRRYTNKIHSTSFYNFPSESIEKHQRESRMENFSNFAQPLHYRTYWLFGIPLSVLQSKRIKSLTENLIESQGRMFTLCSWRAGCPSNRIAWRPLRKNTFRLRTIDILKASTYLRPSITFLSLNSITCI